MTLKCPACALAYTGEEHDTDACIDLWGRRLQQLIREALEKELADKKEVANAAFSS